MILFASAIISSQSGALASALSRVPHKSAISLYEACLFQKIIIFALRTAGHDHITLGRFDQYMYPFYKKETNPEFTKDVLHCFYLKCNTVVFIRSSESAKFFAGFPSGYTLMVGGLDKNGRDATNDFSHLLLELHKDIRLPQPNMSVRIHEQTPYTLYKKAGEVIRMGDGLPQIFNDEANVLAFANRGVNIHDARDYAVVGCVELSIPAKTYGLHDIAMFNLLKCMEIVMHEHPDGFDTFDDLMKAIKEKISLYSFSKTC